MILIAVHRRHSGHLKRDCRAGIFQENAYDPSRFEAQVLADNRRDHGGACPLFSQFQPAAFLGFRCSQAQPIAHSEFSF